MPTAASGICDCPVCTNGVAKSYIFTLSGIQDGTCNQCDEQVNGTWEVHTVPTVGPCTRHGEFLPSGPCGTSKFLNWELSFTKSPDPTPPEKTRADLLSPGPFPVLYRLDKEDLDCISALALTKEFGLHGRSGRPDRGMAEDREARVAEGVVASAAATGRMVEADWAAVAGTGLFPQGFRSIRSMP